MNDLELLFEEVNQINLKLSELISLIKPQSIQSSNLNDDDLIGRFINELEKYQVETDFLNERYSKDDCRNKASYYFDNIQKITNKRAYLNKIVSQIRVFNTDDDVKIDRTDYRKVVDNMNDDQIETVIDKIDPSDLDTIKHQGILANMIITSKTIDQWTDTDKKEIVYRIIKNHDLNNKIIGGVQ